VLPDYGRAGSSKGGMISLFDDEGKMMQIIRFLPEKDLPSSIFSPGNWTEMFFSEFAGSGDIKYAGRIKAVDQKAQREISLQIKKITFNRTFPESVFELVIPKGFESP
jgi:hypothetical protein